jgi:hypothetical protein
MADYLYLIRGRNHESMTPEQMQKHLQKWRTWIENLTKDGIFKDGQPLDKDGKSMRGKKAVVTDGPFAESKDLVNGYLIIKASSLSKATEIAKDCPVFEVDGAVEVREIKDLMSM